MENQNNCPHCGAKMKIWEHSLTPGLVNTLIKFREAVISKGTNSVHLQRETNFTKNEYNNFQKLRYFALAVKTKEAGYWLLTRKGAQFLRNEVSIPKKIKTFRNKIENRSLETVKISDILRNRNVDYWQSQFNYELMSVDKYPDLDPIELGKLF